MALKTGSEANVGKRSSDLRFRCYITLQNANHDMILCINDKSVLHFLIVYLVLLKKIHTLISHGNKTLMLFKLLSEWLNSRRFPQLQFKKQNSLIKAMLLSNNLCVTAFLTLFTVFDKTVFFQSLDTIFQLDEHSSIYSPQSKSLSIFSALSFFFLKKKTLLLGLET